MKKSIKLLCNVMIIFFMLFSALPTFAQETSLTDIESTGITSDDPSSKGEIANIETLFTDDEEAADVESLPASASDESTIENDINESMSESDIDESTSESDIDESMSESDIDESTSESDIDESTSESDIDESTSESDIDESTSESDIDESTSESDIDESTSESDIDESTSESDIENELDLLDVQMPSSVTIDLDPYELNGRGQIYSDEYICENLGNTDVLLTFTEIKVIFANDKDFMALAKPFDRNSESDLKEVYLVMNFSREDIPSVVLTDPRRKGKISIRLSAAKADTADNSFSISFSGNLNESPAINWCSGDIRLKIKYTLETMPSVTTPEGEVFVTTPAGAEFEMGQEGAEAQGKDLSDEDPDSVFSPATTPAGAVFEIDKTEFESQGTVPSEENSAEMDGMDGMEETEITPAGTVQGSSDQDETVPIQLELPELSSSNLLLNTSDIETGISASVYCAGML